MTVSPLITASHTQQLDTAHKHRSFFASINESMDCFYSMWFQTALKWIHYMSNNVLQATSCYLPQVTNLLRDWLIEARCPIHEEWVSVHMHPQQKAAALLTRTYHFNYGHGGLWHYITYTHVKYCVKHINSTNQKWIPGTLLVTTGLME